MSMAEKTRNNHNWMKKYLLILVAATLTVPAAFQSATAQGGTSGYVDIPGTRVKMKLPSGYSVNPYGIGVIHNDRWDQIIVQDNVLGDYYKNAADFKRDEFDKLTSEPVYFEELKIEGHDARFVSIESSVLNLGTMYLVFGDSTFCTMITATYNHKSSLERDEIRNALLSVGYDSDKVVDHTALHLFRVSENLSGFAFNEYSMGMFSYTKENPANAARPFKIMVIPQPVPPKMDEGDIMLIGVEHIKSLPDVSWSRYDIVYPRRSSLSGYRFSECIVETTYSAWYLAVFADTDMHRSVLVMCFFPHDGNEVVDDSELADIKQFVESVRLPIELPPIPLRHKNLQIGGQPGV